MIESSLYIDFAHFILHYAISFLLLDKMMDITFILVTLLFLLTSLLLLRTKKLLHNNNKKVVVPPPSPPKLPLLGHLHLLGSKPHRSLWNLSKKYGPIMLLKVGSIPTVIVSSAAVAREMFKDHDLASCSRPDLTGSRRFSYNFQDLIFSPYGDRWRKLRKFCMLELFSTKRVQSFHHIREEEVGKLLKSISHSASLGTPIDMSQTSYSLTANLIFRIAFGKSFGGGKLDNEDFEHIINRAMLALGHFSTTDFIPGVGWILDWLNGVHKALEKSFVELDVLFQQIVDDHINFNPTSQNEENIVDVLLRMKRDSSEFDAFKLTQDGVKAIIMNIFVAGVETGATSIVWAMAELIRNPKVMKKLQDEIRSYIKDDRVKESDLEKFQYLKIVVKEVLRLHPPGTLLVPRETMSHFKLNGYDIDPKTHIYVNAWAIGRNPEFWTNPEEFFPERFMECNIDYKGQDFDLIPFGAGRRICPGMNMGIIIVELALANMLLCFDWKLPNGMKEEDVDMEEESGLTSSKKFPLRLVPVPYFN